MICRQLESLWRFRGFIVGSVRRDFDARYRRSLLGGLWSVLAPLGTILIYVVVFSKLMNAHLPGMTSPYAYSIYLCTGIICWGLFAEVVNRCSGVFIENANLIKKLNFPRVCLPVVTIVNAMIHFLISAVIFILVLVLGDISAPKLAWAWAIPVICVQVLFAMGLGVLLGVVNVFFRDVGHILGLVLHIWFWATPIVYPVTILPSKVAEFMSWNPMAVIIDSYRKIFVEGGIPQMESLLVVLFEAILISLVAFIWYQKHVDEMVDEL